MFGAAFQPVSLSFHPPTSHDHAAAAKAADVIISILATVFLVMKKRKCVADTIHGPVIWPKDSREIDTSSSLEMNSANAFITHLTSVSYPFTYVWSVQGTRGAATSKVNGRQTRGHLRLPVSRVLKSKPKGRHDRGHGIPSDTGHVSPSSTDDVGEETSWIRKSFPN